MKQQETKRLEKLLERKAEIDAQIASAKAKLRKAEKKKDTRRKILIGACFLEKYKEKQEELKNIMDAFLVRNNDRALFDLPPRTKGD